VIAWFSHLCFPLEHFFCLLYFKFSLFGNHSSIEVNTRFIFLVNAITTSHASKKLYQVFLTICAPHTYSNISKIEIRSLTSYR
jgi:hypothetical protein